MPYTLVFKDATARAQMGEQRGALIRKLIRNGNGFADLLPQTAFGDAPLDQQLAALAAGRPTLLGAIALEFAAIDAEARECSVSLFESVEIPKSHWLVPRLTLGSQDALAKEFACAVADGFSTFKCKVGIRPPDEAKVLTFLGTEFPGQTFRLDVNARLSFEAFVSFWDSLPKSVRARVEFVEDPIPYCEAEWNELRDSHAVPIARDFESGREHEFRVIKPTRERIPEIESEEKGRSVRMAVTTSLDHPVGQLQAAYIAAHFGEYSEHPLVTCGLASHLVYETNPFSEQLGLDKSRLVPPVGTGWGFDQELERLPWKAL